jgi:hypothetical protein
MQYDLVFLHPGSASTVAWKCSVARHRRVRPVARPVHPAACNFSPSVKNIPKTLLIPSMEEQSK